LEVLGPDEDGEILARPLTWHNETPPPTIFMAPEKKGRSALGKGDRVLARLRTIGDQIYEGRTIRVIGAAPARVMGVCTIERGELRLRPTDRKMKSELLIVHGEIAAEPGDLVLAEVLPGKRLGLRQARVSENLGRKDGTKAISLIAIHDKDIPVDFPAEALKQAENAGPAKAEGRVDLRNTPLVTIDGPDARDFDDAVWAEADSDPNNKGGWHLIVAIADVAHYVTQGSALDRAAYFRGNSVYFPDRVVPMLPEALSNGWCSLKPEEERPCLAAHLWLDADGNIKRHRFERALMKSVARLTYEQVQAAVDGNPDAKTAPLIEPLFQPLYGAFEALSSARKKRGALELDLPERKVVLDDEGNVQGISVRERFDSHRLIEEFMIAANVAAAETLEKKQMHCMYRVHDLPSPEKLNSLHDFLSSLKLQLPKGQVLSAHHFNRIIAAVVGTPHATLVNEVILRSQAQAVYTPENLGHFGLGLRRYAHFTSPIRRYSDLLVHRALIRSLGLGSGGLEDGHPDFSEMGEHISITERRAQAAERDAVDRFVAGFLSDRVGSVFAARVSGVTRFGLFLTLEPSGGDGLVPISTLPNDFYEHDEASHSLIGRRTGNTYRLGDNVEALLIEADAITGSLVLHLVDGGKPNNTVTSRRQGKKVFSSRKKKRR
ncbi:MAG: ribonuclease R, partial [Rhodospirillales bacterium]|nr:ribonuclease R [Rhodospirillales bacterium]